MKYSLFKTMNDSFWVRNLFDFLSSLKMKLDILPSLFQSVSPDTDLSTVGRLFEVPPAKKASLLRIEFPSDFKNSKSGFFFFHSCT